MHVVKSHFSFLQGQIEYLSELWPLNQTLSLSSLTGQLRRKDTLQGKRSLQMVWLTISSSAREPRSSAPPGGFTNLCLIAV